MKFTPLAFWRWTMPRRVPPGDGSNTLILNERVTMSAFEGTPLNIALRDCGVNAFVVVGIALEVGIEPTVRHAVDLGYIPVIVADACGYGNKDAAKRALDALTFAGGSLQTDVKTIRALLSRPRVAV